MPQRPTAMRRRTPAPAPGAGAAAWAPSGVRACMAAPASAPAPECGTEAASVRRRGAGPMEDCGAACAPVASNALYGDVLEGTGRAPGQQPQAHAAAQQQEHAAEGRRSLGTLEQRAQARSQGLCSGPAPPAHCWCNPQGERTTPGMYRW